MVVADGSSQEPYHAPEMCEVEEAGNRICGDTCISGSPTGGSSVWGWVCDEYQYVVYEQEFVESTCDDAHDACDVWEGGGAN